MRFALLILALGWTGCARDGARLRGALHPEVFSMIQCWISDTEKPVVTEVNLDAVQRDRNQFNHDGVKQEGGWFVYRVPEGGFKRYRVIEQRGNQYKVEYQDNGGGTLTRDSEIGFTIDKREIQVDGKARVIRTLRVISHSK
jgi:hypothetical protein